MKSRRNTEEYSRALSLAILREFYFGVPVRWRDDQRAGEPGEPKATYDIIIESNPAEAVEVTTVTAPSRLSLEGAIDRHDWFVSNDERPVGSKDWLVHLLPGARFKQAKTDTILRLAVLEDHGLSTFKSWIDPKYVADQMGSPPGLEEALKALLEIGVEYAENFAWKRHGVGFQVGSLETSPRPLSTLRAIQLELEKPDNIAKLRASSAGRRHLFVVFERQAGTTWSGLAEAPPADFLDLPDGIDQVWAATHLPGLDGARLWRFVTGRHHACTFITDEIVSMSPFSDYREYKHDGDD
jgi:hypothetical protein